MRYGVAYKGSKNAIVDDLIKALPGAEYFVDLFAGGCAMTHGAMVSGNYKRFIANDIETTPKLFKDAIDGKYRNETRWISREDFFKLKDTDEYIRLCWSFGNNGRDYLYSKEIEPWKKALHYARVFNDYSLINDILQLKETITPTLFDENSEKDYASRIWIKRHFQYCKDKYVEWYKKNYCDDITIQSLQSLQCLQSLQRLQRLQSLESLQCLQSLEIFQKDYQDIVLPEDAVIYCDIPYLNTAQYQVEGFNHERFYKWLNEINRPVFISEYTAPPHCSCILTIKKRALMTQNESSQKYSEEKLFIQSKYLDWYNKKMKVNEQLSLFDEN